MDECYAKNYAMEAKVSKEQYPAAKSDIVFRELLMLNNTLSSLEAIVFGSHEYAFESEVPREKVGLALATEQLMDSAIRVVSEAVHRLKTVNEALSCLPTKGYK